MKRIKGIKSFSALETKSLSKFSLLDIVGGLAQGTINFVQSNFKDANGCPDYDAYVDGKFAGRVFTCYFQEQGY